MGFPGVRVITKLVYDISRGGGCGWLWRVMLITTCNCTSLGKNYWKKTEPVVADVRGSTFYILG